MELQIESLQVKAADEEVRRQLEVKEIDRQIAEVGEPMIDAEIDRQVAEFERKIAEFEQEMIHLDAENRALEIEENLQARIDKMKKISDRFSRDRR